MKRINALIKDIKRHPFEGIGMAEPLKGNLSGFWSKRIDDANRLVYAAEGTTVIIIACRNHYAVTSDKKNPGQGAIQTPPDRGSFYR
ncbi:Txe/YoeB family addiction module toxin [Selenomonas sp. WCA-380-WT-3B 3/]|uniref:Endoribonuclease YoeB n=1 Tax=Selenomonas montiformis TaxID=2652285 RepID=A0A6I2UW46_9FIRM|nr:Txe/YoeB family addiction module toxin [Selenomonas montiformis]